METPTVETPRLLWTVGQLSAATQSSRSFIYQQIAAGRLDTVHLGRACRITSAAVENFINDLAGTEE